MLFCGIDIGTTNTKAILVDRGGRVIERMVIPQESRADIYRIDAHIWYQHFSGLMEKVSPHFVDEAVYVSLTMRGASFTLLDKNFEPVTSAWVWTGQAKPERSSCWN